MVRILRTNSDNISFRGLVALLDADLAQRDGDDHPFYAQYNKIDKIKHAVVAYVNEKPAGCGAIKEYEKDTAEVKRMFVCADHRRKGIARRILSELEQWAEELHYSCCILETGKKQPEAIALYQNSGYTLIPNYGQYANIDNSICMKKVITTRQKRRIV